MQFNQMRTAPTHSQLIGFILCIVVDNWFDRFRLGFRGVLNLIYVKKGSVSVDNEIV